MKTDDTPQDRVLATFDQHYGAPPTVLVRAPGRVNLIGEHTDYNDGFVLPCAIGFATYIAARPRDDAVVQVVAADWADATDAFLLDAPLARRPDAPWADYVRGVFWVLQQRGHALRGVDIAVAGDVPQGAGLSSSAALQVGMATALREVLGLPGLDATTVALVAQEAENRFVGCQCGIMDQLISARGRAGHALLIDCRSLQTRAVPLPPGAAVMVVESGVQRGLVDSAYNERRVQCQAAAAHLGVPALRDATMAQLQAARATLDPQTFARAHHVISENARTLAAADALAASDLAAMGRLMAASHDSMRDDFEITVPAIDHLVEILQDSIGAQGGARMTGGGFGGCVVALLPTAQVTAARAAVMSAYRSPDGQPARVHVTVATAGAERLR